MNSLLAPAGAARGGRGGWGARATWALMGLELLAAAPRRQVHRRLVDHVVLDGVDAHLKQYKWLSDYVTTGQDKIVAVTKKFNITL